ncbi:BnaA07g07720D [Brassica napus]|uniref:BnaA07g07720D protein n=1 Tax=Brassica napus TaxID=3708 RepID=A0A078HZ66_BRANA|nr:BnaA07g07720D [Brassica napus]
MVTKSLIGFSATTRKRNFCGCRISDNKFIGIIPRFIGDWSRLEKIHLFASGLKGPIPDALARLEILVDLRISDMTGINSFPNISSKYMNTLILRNLSLSGQIPSFVWSMPVLKTLDVSFNKLSGEVDLQGKVPKYTYLNDNMLSGNVGSGAFLNNESYIDLSYNNFSYPSSCPDKSININSYRSSYLQKNLTGLLPCASPIKCNYLHYAHP